MGRQCSRQGHPGTKKKAPPLPPFSGQKALFKGGGWGGGGGAFVGFSQKGHARQLRLTMWHVVFFVCGRIQHLCRYVYIHIYLRISLQFGRVCMMYIYIYAGELVLVPLFLAFQELETVPPF